MAYRFKIEREKMRRDWLLVMARGLRGALAVRLSSRRRLAAVSQPSLSRRRVSPRASLVSPRVVARPPRHLSASSLRVVARPLAISLRLPFASSRAPSPFRDVFPRVVSRRPGAAHPTRARGSGGQARAHRHTRPPQIARVSRSQTQSLR